jgi:uncharacterized phage-like protein YoqJ
MIVGFTGHRKLSHPEQKIVKETITWLRLWKPEKAISGMAIGFDQLAARACIYLGIPLVAALPAKGQPERWPEAMQKLYYKILDRAAEIVYIDTVPGYNSGRNFIEKLFIRNRWIVDKSDRILAYYDGSHKGGTFHTISYAEKNMKVCIPLQLL